MSRSAVLSSIRRLRSLMAVQQNCEQSDEELLAAFANCRDEIAFATLVRRYGPMVLGVCRRVLGHVQDAEDAYQATFLVLARRAAVLRDKTALSSFLYGIAYHLASKIKRAAGRRRRYEGSLGALTQPRSPADPADELLWREIRELLDEEIARLPEKYRSVFVLCCLENLSRAEAAQRLGQKERTVLSRLAEARKRLSRRLARRGVELTAVLAATAVATPSASAVPAALMATTIEAAVMAAGEGLSAIVSASVAELVQSATTAAMMNKVKVTAVMLLTVAISGSLVGWYERASGPLAATAEAPAGKADEKQRTTSPKRETPKTVDIQGRVFDPDGKPKAGAKLLLLCGDKAKPLGAAGADGRFRIAIAKEAKKCDLIAQAEGYGLDFHDLARSDLKKTIELRLVKDRAIRGRIVNTEGKPVAGVRVSTKTINVYPNHSLDSFLAVWKKRHYMSGIPGGEKHLWTEAATLLPATTDADGRFVLHGVGDERLASLNLRGAGIADMEVWIANRAGFDPKPYNQATLDNTPKGEERGVNVWMLHGPEVSIVAESEKPIHGIVKDADSGKGRPGVVVRLTRIDNGNLVSPIVVAKTDAQGRYEIHGARKVKRCMLEVSTDTDAGYMPCQIWAEDTPGYQPITVDIKVKKGVLITGKVIDGGTRKAIPGFAMAAVLRDNPFAKNYPSFDNSAWFPRRETDASGTFRVVAIPGPVLLMGGSDYKSYFHFKHPEPDPKYPQYFNKRDRIGFFAEYLGYGGGISPVQGNWCKVLEIKPGAQFVKQDIVLERASVLPVRIQDNDGQALTGVWVAGVSPEDWHSPIQCDKAECSVYQLEPGKPRLVAFFHLARKLTGTVTLKGDEKTPIVAKLGPTGAIKGRLLDADGKPLSGVVVDVNYRQRAAKEVHNRVHRERQVLSAADGTFTVEDLIPDQRFELFFHRGPFKRRFQRLAKPADPTAQVKPGECCDLGAIKLKRIPETAGD